VDFTVITESELHLEQYQKIQKQYLWLKKIIPNLGEYEIYQWDEWKVKESLQNEEPFLLKIRTLRKLRWAYKDRRTHFHRYHIYKRNRGFQKIADLFCHEKHPHDQRCLNRGLDLSIRNLAEQNAFKILCDNPLQSVDHEFLGLKLATSASEPADIVLSVGSLNHLVALLPLDKNPYELQDARSQRLRHAILQDECISVHSYLRLQPEKETEIRGWIDYLKQEMTKLY
jgi:hypothetical protein